MEESEVSSRAFVEAREDPAVMLRWVEYDLVGLGGMNASAFLAQMVSRMASLS